MLKQAEADVVPSSSLVEVEVGVVVVVVVEVWFEVEGWRFNLYLDFFHCLHGWVGEWLGNWRVMLNSTQS